MGECKQQIGESGADIGYYVGVKRYLLIRVLLILFRLKFAVFDIGDGKRLLVLWCCTVILIM